MSDADRLAARELYNQGDQLQQAGRFPEALDKFQRSYATFNAPTTALHIAECQAAMLRLVEAAETYRGVANLQLDDKSPDAFRKARDQAAAELAQIEPRIPHLTIVVTPQPNTLNNLVVTVDGAPMRTALVGVARPINPGVHKITAVAAGYLQAEGQIDVKERSSPGIQLDLKPGGVVYTPVNPQPQPQPQPQPYPPNYYQQQPQPWVPPPAPHISKMSLLLGGFIGAQFATGDITTGANSGLSTELGPGGGAGLDVAFRFARSFAIGGMLSGAGFSSGGSGIGSGGSTFYAGPYLGYMSNPEGVGLWGEIGGVYRHIDFNSARDDVSGGDFLLGLGIHIKAGRWLRLVPKAQMFAGLFTNQDNGGSIRNQAPHFMFTLGMSIYFDLDLDKSSAPQ